eukprot:m.255537 g.255537  ORF g.255537 m.255537 type:complete len:167 (-) comp19552_c0_seq1:75-575(-)
MHPVLFGVLAVYFGTHIPISIVLDSQVVFPRAWYPAFATNLFDFYTSNFPDFLFANCRTRYPYVRWIGVCEVFLQLPFFFVALYALARRREWIRIPAIIYCTHVPTTVIPAVADFLQNPEAEQYPLDARVRLSMLYGLYFLIPLVWLVDLVRRDHVFSSSVKAKAA